jgi:hypothetical protein
MQVTKSRFVRSIFTAAMVVAALTLSVGVFAETAESAAKLKPTVSFTGAPASAANGTTFTVTATTNDGTTATITATGACTVPTGSTGGTVTVTVTENKGTCILTASWPATQTYLAAKATQKTTATLGYTESDIYHFGTNYAAYGDDGERPRFNGMVFDGKGNIFASTWLDFNSIAGAIVELSPAGNGTWNETLVYGFNRSSGGFTGFGPQGTLAMDRKGNIYGTTQYGGGAYNLDTGEYACGSLGGTWGCGTVYELSKNADGVWTATDLYDFGVNNANDGIWPVAGVTLGNTSATTMYGTTESGGTSSSLYSGFNGLGTIYELSYTKPTKGSPGGWQESVLYSFPATGNEPSEITGLDGQNPLSGLLLTGGNLYGTTAAGGGPLDANGWAAGGVIYELSPGASGWTFNKLYVFCPDPAGPCPDGLQPGHGTVVTDSEGNLYGTTNGNGNAGINETVWQLPYSAATKSYANEVQILYSQPNYSSWLNAWPGLGEWVLSYKNSWYVLGWSAPNESCCGTLVEITNSAKTGWQATTIYQFPPSGFDPNYSTLWNDVNQLIVDKNGNFYSIATYGGNGSGAGLGYGGVFQISPMP